MPWDSELFIAFDSLTNASKGYQGAESNTISSFYSSFMVPGLLGAEEHDPSLAGPGHEGSRLRQGPASVSSGLASGLDAKLMLANAS